MVSTGLSIQPWCTESTSVNICLELLEKVTTRKQGSTASRTHTMCSGCDRMISPLLTSPLTQDQERVLKSKHNHPNIYWGPMWLYSFTSTVLDLEISHKLYTLEQRKSFFFETVSLCSPRWPLLEQSFCLSLTSVGITCPAIESYFYKSKFKKAQWIRVLFEQAQDMRSSPQYTCKKRGMAQSWPWGGKQKNCWGCQPRFRVSERPCLKRR